MGNYRDELINKPKAFLRESFEVRMEEHGFKNIERMEKFLWNLELFQQIQRELGDRIVLKWSSNPILFTIRSTKNQRRYRYDVLWNKRRY